MVQFGSVGVNLSSKPKFFIRCPIVSLHTVGERSSILDFFLLNVLTKSKKGIFDQKPNQSEIDTLEKVFFFAVKGDIIWKID